MKRVELIRNSVRATIANLNLGKNAVVTADYSIEIRQLADAIRKLDQKTGNIEKTINSKSFDTNYIGDNIAKIKIRECIQNILKNTKTANTTTVDRIREHIKKRNPSLTQHLVSSSNRAFSLLDEVLYELQVKGEIERKYGGIIKFSKG